jgi:polar amino acid transport system substrate-binding protein
MKHVFGVVLAGLVLSVSTAQAADLTAHARPRPPELIVENGAISGPLKDVLDEVARATGMTVSWEVIPFARSLVNLRNKQPVIVPRVLKTVEREKFITFLLPIAEQYLHIHFIVKQGNESNISDYNSLRNHIIGVKRGSVYFEKFDNDTTLKKVFVTDDDLLCKMLEAGRIDILATIDLSATETMMKSLGYTNYSIAVYHEDIVSGNYFAIAKDGPLQAKADILNAALKDMVNKGRIEEIYRQYNLDPREIKQ